MTATVDAGSEAAEDNAASYVLSGETKLLDVEDLSSKHRWYASSSGSSATHRPAPITLDLSNRAEGVQIFIGGESGLAPLDGCESVMPALRGRRPGGRLARCHRPPPARPGPRDPRSSFYHRPAALERPLLQALIPACVCRRCARPTRGPRCPVTGPEPIHRHDSTPRTGVLLSMGTPPAPTAAAPVPTSSSFPIRAW